MISILNYFILGVIFYVVVIPIIEGLSGLLVQAIEVAKGYLLILLAQEQTKMKSLKTEISEEKTKLIGFALPDEIEEEEEDEYDE